MTGSTTLLPPNATPLQRALEQVEAARLDAIGAANAGLWNPWTCPLAVLPWVAALHFSVDVWVDAWPEAKKRAVAAASLEIHRHKGTRWALEQALALLDRPAQVVEWFEAAPAGAPYTFRVVVAAGDTLTRAEIELTAAAIAAAKNLRSWLAGLRFTADRGAAVFVGAASRVRVRATVLPRTGVAVVDDPTGYFLQLIRGGGPAQIAAIDAVA